MQNFYNYMWVNQLDEKCYIGFSGRIFDRYDEELKELEGGVKFNNCITHPLLRAYKKHGPENFKFIIVGTYETKQEAVDIEISLIAEYKKLGLVYNLTDGGEGWSIGQKHSEKSKKLMSEKLKGKPRSPEAVEKSAASKRGKKLKPLTDEHKKKIGDAHRGRKKSLEEIEEIRQTNLGQIPWNKGKKMSVEQVEKIRIAHGGRWKKYLAFGEEKSINEWSEDSRCVVNLSTLGFRIRVKSWDTEIALLTPSKSEFKYKVFGEEKSLVEWAEDSRCVVGVNTFRTRLFRSKWDLEKALTTLPDKRNRILIKT